MSPNPKKLILGLLLAAPANQLTVQQAINGCSLFNISENHVRVSLVRLSTEGKIESCGRGAYQLGPQARATADEVADWELAEDKVIDWDGSYIAVHSAALPKSDRKAAKVRNRAFEMLGFAPLERSLHIRPNNIVGGAQVMRQHLLALGVEPTVVSFEAQHFSAEHANQISGLWDSAALNQRYQQETVRLTSWIQQHHELELEVAARESYLIGSQAIRQVVFDPWLPEPMVNTQARHEFVAVVKQFDKVGKNVWRQLGEQHEAMPTAARTTPLDHQTLH